MFFDDRPRTRAARTHVCEPHHISPATGSRFSAEYARTAVKFFDNRPYGWPMRSSAAILARHMSLAYVRRPLDGDSETAQQAATLHLELLAHSPIAVLGPGFLTKFYYGLLPKDRLVVGSVAEVDGHPAGFIAAAADADGFMKRALRRRFVSAAWLTGLAALGRPSRIGAVWEILQISSHRETAPEPGMGELLSFGVRPQFRRSRTPGENGQPIALDLLESALASLRALGANRVRSLVDQNNTAARLFYRSLGWELGAQSVPGWRTPQVEYVLTLPTPSPPAVS
jgi:ribosomal protein S18 acetylase RimI-like enzyme